MDCANCCSWSRKSSRFARLGDGRCSFSSWAFSSGSLSYWLFNFTRASLLRRVLGVCGLRLGGCEIGLGERRRDAEDPAEGDDDDSGERDAQHPDAVPGHFEASVESSANLLESAFSLTLSVTVVL